MLPNTSGSYVSSSTEPNSSNYMLRCAQIRSPCRSSSTTGLSRCQQRSGFVGPILLPFHLSFLRVKPHRQKAAMLVQTQYRMHPLDHDSGAAPPSKTLSITPIPDLPTYAQYIGLAAICLNLFGFFGHNFTQESCERYYHVMPIVQCVASWASHIIFVVRTSAIWNKERLPTVSLSLLAFIVSAVEIFAQLFAFRKFKAGSSGNCLIQYSKKVNIGWVYYMVCLVCSTDDTTLSSRLAPARSFTWDRVRETMSVNQPRVEPYSTSLSSSSPTSASLPTSTPALVNGAMRPMVAPKPNSTRSSGAHPSPTS